MRSTGKGFCSSAVSTSFSSSVRGTPAPSATNSISSVSEPRKRSSLFKVFIRKFHLLASKAYLDFLLARIANGVKNAIFFLQTIIFGRLKRVGPNIPVIQTTGFPMVGGIVTSGDNIIVACPKLGKFRRNVLLNLVP